MRIGIVLAGAIVRVMRIRLFGRELFEPALEVRTQPGFVVVDEHRRRDVHGVQEAEPLANAAFPQTGLHIGSDVAEGPACREFEPQFLSIRIHLKNSVNRWKRR